MGHFPLTGLRLVWLNVQHMLMSVSHRPWCQETVILLVPHVSSIYWELNLRSNWGHLTASLTYERYQQVEIMIKSSPLIIQYSQWSHLSGKWLNLHWDQTNKRHWAPPHPLPPTHINDICIHGWKFSQLFQNADYPKSASKSCIKQILIASLTYFQFI